MDKTPKYNNVNFKDKDYERITGVTDSKTSQNKKGDVKKQFVSYSESLKDNGDVSKSLDVQKNDNKVKSYFLSKEGDSIKLQIHKQTPSKDSYKIVEGNRAERKFDRATKKNGN